MVQLTDALVKQLVTLAQRRVDTDNDFSPYDYEDGPDGPWDGGFDEGETSLARELLDALNITYVIPPGEDD